MNLLPLLLASALLASCAGDDAASSSSSGPRPLSERLSGERGYQQDAEGNWIAKANKRSHYDSYGESPNFKGEYNAKEYKTGEYAKKSWWAPAEVERKTFDNRADASRFQKNSPLQGQGAREAGTDSGLAKTYGTDDYPTNAAREASAARIAKPSDAETDFRRRVFAQPEDNIDWRAQRSLTQDQTRGMTGR